MLFRIRTRQRAGSGCWRRQGARPTPAGQTFVPTAQASIPTSNRPPPELELACNSRRAGLTTPGRVSSPPSGLTTPIIAGTHKARGSGPWFEFTRIPKPSRKPAPEGTPVGLNGRLLRPSPSRSQPSRCWRRARLIWRCASRGLRRYRRSARRTQPRCRKLSGAWRSRWRYSRPTWERRQPRRTSWMPMCYPWSADSLRPTWRLRSMAHGPSFPPRR